MCSQPLALDSRPDILHLTWLAANNIIIWKKCTWLQAVLVQASSLQPSRSKTYMKPSGKALCLVPHAEWKQVPCGAGCMDPTTHYSQNSFGKGLQTESSRGSRFGVEVFSYHKQAPCNCLACKECTTRVQKKCPPLVQSPCSTPWHELALSRTQNARHCSVCL